MATSTKTLSAPARVRPLPTSHFIYGGDYNPEQWSEEVWREDARLMREAGVTLVSLGIFAWARLEPRPGVYEFDWLDRVVGLLHSHGVSVNLATPTASPPPWLVRLHPEILPVTAEGVTLWHGARRHYCPHSPAYHEHAARLVAQLARHYRDHPALALWHVDNEYACHIAECFCDVSAAAFRRWLQARYGTLEQMNGAWGTAFWSQRYDDWEEIQPPRRAPTFVNPTQRLDWMRFCSDSWIACFEDQRTILREITPQVPLTTNFMGFHKPIDYWALAAREDVVANDSYPDTSNPEWMIDSGMTCDLMRSLGGGRPWVLMEQAPTHVNWRARNATKRPGVMRLGSYQAAARGANGIMFFQWRASQAGAEKFHSGMVPHAGTDSRVWREVTALGEELGRLDGLLASEVRAEVAIVFDWESWWALELDSKPSSEIRLLPAIRSYYAGFFRRNIAVDFVHPESDLSRYRLVVAPHLYLVNDQAVQNIEAYVAGGGRLVMSFFSGIVDEHDHVRLGGYPAPFQKMLGLCVEEFAPYAEAQTNTLYTQDEDEFESSLWSDIIRLQGAEAIAHYLGDYYAGSPAITWNRFGKGGCFYVGTALDAGGQAWLLDRACSEAGLSAPPGGRAPDGVELVRRTNGAQTWLFALNYSSEEVDIPHDRPGYNLLSGARLDKSARLGPGEVAVIQLDPS
jgi:beta-galactosidase